MQPSARGSWCGWGGQYQPRPIWHDFHAATETQRRGHRIRRASGHEVMRASIAADVLAMKRIWLPKPRWGRIGSDGTLTIGWGET